MEGCVSTEQATEPSVFAYVFVMKFSDDILDFDFSLGIDLPARQLLIKNEAFDLKDEQTARFR